MTLPLTWLLLALLPGGEPLLDAGGWCGRLGLLDVSLYVVQSPLSELVPLLVPAGERTEMLTSQAALRARLLLLAASLHELADEPDAARKDREAAEDALELALADGKAGRAALAEARELLARARQGRLGQDAPRVGPAVEAADGDEPGELEQLRAELRDARAAR